MDTLIDIVDEKFLLSLFLAVFTVVYIYSAQRFFLKSKEKKKLRKIYLWSALSKGFEADTISSVEDVVNIYKGIHELGGEDVSYRAGLSKNLREYLVSIISDGTREPYSVKKIKSQVTTIINTIEKETPFSDVPAAERNLLTDIQRFIDLEDAASATDKLANLAGLVEVRQDSIEKLQSSNKWSVPLAAIGLVLTIVFGVISLIK